MSRDRWNVFFYFLVSLVPVAILTLVAYLIVYLSK
jgi:hypothetical protein